MIVGSVIFLTVFASLKIPDLDAGFSAKFFHEELEVPLLEASVFWKIFFVIGEGDKGVVLVFRCLVHHADRPVFTVFKSTTDALTAWKYDRKVFITVLFVEDYATFP